MKTNAAIVDTHGRKWSPFESQAGSGHVTYTETAGDIHVPYGTDPVSLTVQAHELSHVRYTAKVWPNVKTALKRLTELASTTAPIVGYAEDMRITALAGSLGVKTLPEFGNADDAPVIDGWIASFVAAGIPAERAERAVRFVLTEHTSVLETLGLTVETLQRKGNAERYIVHCAAFIHNLLSRGESSSERSDESGDSDESKSGRGDSSESSSSSSSDRSESESSEAGKNNDSSGGDESESESGSDSSKTDSDESSDNETGKSSDESGDGDGDADGGSGEVASAGDGAGTLDLSKLVLPDVKVAMVNNVPPPVDTDKLVQEFQHVLETARWIPVEKIDRVALVRRAVHARRSGRKLSETGISLGSAYDAVSPNERRPFLAKRRGGVGGLTVAIDCSGSMSISDAEIEQLLTVHPQGVVVTYSSKLSYDAKPETAIVRVIASHGRIAAEADFRDRHAGANGCDGPILLWLSRQAGERIWICDGHITETRDSTVVYEPASMAEWLKVHRITQYYSLWSYLETLRGGE